MRQLTFEKILKMLLCAIMVVYLVFQYKQFSAMVNYNGRYEFIKFRDNRPGYIILDTETGEVIAKQISQ